MVKEFGYLGIPLIDGKICLNLYNPERYKTSKKNVINAKRYVWKLNRLSKTNSIWTVNYLKLDYERIIYPSYTRVT